MKFSLSISAASVADAIVQVRNARTADPQLVPHIVVDFAEHVLNEGVFPTDGPLIVRAEADTYQDEGAQFHIFVGRMDPLKERMDRERPIHHGTGQGGEAGAATDKLAGAASLGKTDLPRVILDFTAGSRAEALSLLAKAQQDDPATIYNMLASDIQKNIETAFTDDGPLHVKVTHEKDGYRTIEVTRPTEGAFPDAAKPNEARPRSSKKPELKTGEKAQE